MFESSAKRFFSILYMIFRSNFVKMFLVYGQKYPLEISAPTGVIDHAGSEYAIFIIREPTVQNSSTVIWKDLSYFLLRNLFLKIFAGTWAYPSEIIIDHCSTFYALSNDVIFMVSARRKFF